MILLISGLYYKELLLVLFFFLQQFISYNFIMYSTLRVKESKFHHIFVSISSMETHWQMKTFPYCFLILIIQV